MRPNKKTRHTIMPGFSNQERIKYSVINISKSPSMTFCILPVSALVR